MGCGKISYESEELAREALIQNRIKNNHREGSGPINIYECSNCGLWHFTSKGDQAKFLLEQETIDRIKHERRLNEWSKGW